MNASLTTLYTSLFEMGFDLVHYLAYYIMQAYTLIVMARFRLTVIFIFQFK